MFIQNPTLNIFVKFSKPYINFGPYVCSFCQNFQCLHLFPALRQFRSTYLEGNMHNPGIMVVNAAMLTGPPILVTE